VDDTLDELMDANFYTHLDLASGFWQVRVRDQDIHKTALQTHDGLMEWVAMPFGLCNALAPFQKMMNDNLRDFLHKFVIVYLDDVCVYSRTLEEHLEHMRLVLQRCKEEGVKLHLKKCFFGLHEMEDLGYTVSFGIISVSTKKVEAVADWPVPTTQKEVRSFGNSAISTPYLFIISATLRLH
jgi:small nuclear ribonucleoprotein (snRNP)-like protein